jgi:hypothetical protein
MQGGTRYPRGPALSQGSRTRSLYAWLGCSYAVRPELPLQLARAGVGVRASDVVLDLQSQIRRYLRAPAHPHRRRGDPRHAPAYTRAQLRPRAQSGIGSLCIMHSAAGRATRACVVAVVWCPPGPNVDGGARSGVVRGAHIK